MADWTRAEASCAAHLARVAGQFGALDDRLRGELAAPACFGGGYGPELVCR